MRDVNPDIAENIPGKDNDRKTPRGELNWIFTAITDTIAWNTLPSKTFQKMFRQDLLVASLFRFVADIPEQSVTLHSFYCCFHIQELPVGQAYHEELWVHSAVVATAARLHHPRAVAVLGPHARILHHAQRGPRPGIFPRRPSQQHVLPEQRTERQQRKQQCRVSVEPFFLH